MGPSGAFLCVLFSCSLCLLQLPPIFKDMYVVNLALGEDGVADYLQIYSINVKCFTNKMNYHNYINKISYVLQTTYFYFYITNSCGF